MDIKRMLGRWVMAMSFLAIPAQGREMPETDEELFALSMKELLEIEVTTAARKPQKLAEVSAAIYVITRDDIRRSGATSVPEALRLAPGVQVGRIDSNKWAVSVRGFNGRFANKLLVLVDGRSVYSPLFSGVFWDAQDLDLANVRQIEIIRGPGATLWGANAVNGVINIITLHGGDIESVGPRFTAGVGTEERAFGSLSYGALLGENMYYRASAKYVQRDGGKLLATGDDGADDWHVSRAELRYDWDPGRDDEVTLEGAIYNGDGGESLNVFSPQNNALESRDGDINLSGGHVRFHWMRGHDFTSNFAVKMYYERSNRRQLLIDEKRDTWDVDFQHSFSLFEGNDLMWGVGYRYTYDQITSNEISTTNPESRSDHLFSGFIQDDLAVLPDILTLTLGSKFEHNDYTGFEFQPNIRLAWTPVGKQSVWASVTRAVRTPSRGEHDGISTAGITNNPEVAPLPIVTIISGNKNLDSEELFAYELGYRIQFENALSLDFTAFYYDYDHVLAADIGGVPEFDERGFIRSPLTLTNNVSVDSYGFEAAMDWRIKQAWRLQANYSYLGIQAHDNISNPLLATANESAYESTPHHQVSVRSSIDLPYHVKTDLWLRYTDNLTARGGIDSYLTMDVRFAWTPIQNLEFSIVGQNLLDSQRLEYTSELNDVLPIEVQRAGYFQIRWGY